MRKMQPFTVSVSSNVELFEFSWQWHHRRHYQAVFNAQNEIIPRHFAGLESWALIADWRRWLVQVPESERLCIRALRNFVTTGLSHYAILSDGHPVAKWQANRVKNAVPEVQVEIFDDRDESIQWLRTEGFDVQFRPLEFDQNWLYPSPIFSNILSELEVDKSLFAAV